MNSLSTQGENNLTPNLSVEDICLLANSFCEKAHYKKAVDLYESACKLFPNNMALKINLARVKNLLNQALDHPNDIVRDEPYVLDVQSDKYQGLGETLLRTGLKSQAKHIFELSKHTQPRSYRPYYFLGKIHYEDNNHLQAAIELKQARDINPFDLKTLWLLGKAFEAGKNESAALEAFVDGFIVSGEAKSKTKTGFFTKEIKSMLNKISGMTHSMLGQLIASRRKFIESIYREIQEELTEKTPPGGTDPQQWGEYSKQSETSTNQQDAQIFSLLKNHLIFQSLDESQLNKLLKFTSLVSIHEGDFVYHESDPVFGLYFVERGLIQIQKETPHGVLVFNQYGTHQFFGDDAILSGRERFTGAKAMKESDLLFLDKAGLAMMFARDRKLAIHFLWYFWKSLSLQVRQSNTLMTEFFSHASHNPHQTRKIIRPAQVRTTQVEIDKKMEVLQTKGLSSKELSLIARLSNEEVYNQNETIFQEGDLGDRLYIVLEGTVMITKQIPGVGEEALAILKKGDFFGEMALAGADHLRSADAKAQEQGTTLLVINRQILKEILAIDVDSAFQFLTILCRILSQRLLELNEKIYQWKMISGGF